MPLRKKGEMSLKTKKMLNRFKETYDEIKNREKHYRRKTVSKFELCQRLGLPGRSFHLYRKKAEEEFKRKFPVVSLSKMNNVCILGKYTKTGKPLETRLRGSQIRILNVLSELKKGEKTDRGKLRKKTGIIEQDITRELKLMEKKGIDVYRFIEKRLGVPKYLVKRK